MITIKALSPELENDYFDFFDNRAFSDGSPYYPCYCNAFNMSVGEIVKMRELAKPMLKNQYGQYLLKVIDEMKEEINSNTLTHV